MMFICRTCEEREKKAGRCKRAHSIIAIMQCESCKKALPCVYCNCQQIRASQDTTR
jgi:hypothetical protein